jgi:hypothetical protein
MVETKEVEIVSALILLPMFLFGLVFSLSFAMGTVVGGALVTINFYLLNRGIKGMFLGRQKKIKFLLQYMVRFVLLALIVYLVIYLEKINVAGFIVGLSAVFLGIVICLIKNEHKAGGTPRTRTQYTLLLLLA